MKKRLHFSLLLLAFALVRLNGQGTFPDPFDMSSGATFTLLSFNHCGMPTCDPPVNMSIGEEAIVAQGSFVTPLLGDASYGTAQGNWYAEGPNGISYESSNAETRASFLLNLITTNRQDIAVGWKVNDIAVYPNTAYIELQYRIGTVSDFIDVTGDLYQQGTTPSGTTFSLTLPAAANNVELVQVRWIYYEIGSGATDRLALDDIMVSSSPLPVELTRFDAYAQRNEVLLEWQTATESRNAQFVVERSGDGRTFSTLRTLAGAGDSRSPIDYATTDAAPLRGQSFYRLKQVDFDGTFEYSPVRAVFMGGANTVRLAPTLVADALTASVPEARLEDIRWTIFDLQGRSLRIGIWPAETAELPISLGDLPTGGYIFNAGGEAQRFFKN